MRNGIDFTKMAARVKKATGAETFAKLHDFAPVTASVEGVTPSVFKVVVSFSKEADKQALYKAVAAATDNKVSPIEASFRPIPGTKAFVGFVARNAEVREYETASVEKMKVMASNLLMDEADKSLWEVRSNGDARFLTRHAEDDLSELVALASVRTDNRTFGIPVLSSLGTPEAVVNEAVVFVNPETASICHAIIIASCDDGIEAVDMDSLERVKVDPETVVEMASFDAKEVMEAFPEVASPENYNAPTMEAYYKQVFGYDAAYWAEFKKILDSRATI